MARISKHALLQIVERSIREGGWGVLYLSPNGEHPARYQVHRDGQSYPVRVYIWNLTHGGGAARPSNEYRIQITGIASQSDVQQFEPEIGGKTLILGWWAEGGVFAGFDYTKHAGPLGASPSIQIGEAALRAAYTTGFAPHNKGNGELAIAFRPDFLVTYVASLEALHQCGNSDREVEVLRQIGEGAAGFEADKVEEEISESRRFAVVTTIRALRDMDFRNRVLTAYGFQCAFCGIQLKLVEAAHILPVMHAESTDQTRNGVSLCSLHHRAYDKGLVTFDEDHLIRLNEKMLHSFKVGSHDAGMEAFRAALHEMLHLPPDKRDRPAPEFVKAANALRGWS